MRPQTEQFLFKIAATLTVIVVMLVIFLIITSCLGWLVSEVFTAFGVPLTWFQGWLAWVLFTITVVVARNVFHGR